MKKFIWNLLPLTEIYDAAGQLVKSVIQDKAINVAHFSKGLYWIKFQIKTIMYTGRNENIFLDFHLTSV